MSDSYILVIDGVTKKFGGLVANNKVSFNMKRGEILGLIGPNGAGKTTLFNVITGVYKPDEGRVVFKGRDISGKPPHVIARMGIAKTHQIVKPFNDMTVIENAMVGALFGKRAGKITMTEARRIAHQSLELVGLVEKEEEFASKLTLHEKKMLELARALSAEPELLLLDEVLAGLNPREIEESLKIIRKAKEERDLSIIMIEHVMHAVMNIAERIVVLHYGWKIAEGTPEEIANNAKVITAYLGDPRFALRFVKRRGGDEEDATT